MPRNRLHNYPEFQRKSHHSKNLKASPNISRSSKGIVAMKKEASGLNPKTKIYVIDTTVFLHDPHVIEKLKDNYIVIPMAVYNELNEFKKDMGEFGSHSRHISDCLKRNLGIGNFRDGITLKNGGKLFIDTEKDIRSFEPLKNQKDNVGNRILAVALKQQDKYPKNPVVIISNNPSILIKASAYGIKAEEYKNDQVEIYEGCREIQNHVKLFEVVKRNHKTSCPPDIKMIPNEFAILKHGNEKIEAIYQKGFLIQLMPPKHDNVFGIKPLDLEQKLTLHLLLDPDIDLVTITGEAGTGKTLLALASAFEQVINRKIYSRIAVARPIVPMGRDLGFLPGTVEEKVRPYMRPIFDSLDRIFLNYKPTDLSEKPIQEKESSAQDKKSRKKMKRNGTKKANDNEVKRPSPYWQKYIDSGILQIEALSLIRGATLPRLFFIIDEAQNLTGDELKTIITRAGHGTKIVLTGDIKQIDCPYLTEKNNGLSITIHRLKESCLSGHMTLKNVHRSRLADLGVTYL